MNHWQQIKHKMQPRENQIQAINNCVEGFLKNSFHGLFLEMSLGKTKISLNVAEIMKKYNKVSRLLIVVPKSIQSVWLDEIPLQSNFEDEPVTWENKQTIKKQKQISGLFVSEFPILIVRLELFQKKNELLKTFLQHFFEKPTMVILDESSKIKNVTTKRTPRLIEYIQGSVYRTALTGTPVSESPLDVFSQMEFMQVGFWYKFNNAWSPSVLRKHWYIFKSRYAVMQDMHLNEGRKIQVMVGTQRTEEIARKIRTHTTQQKSDDWLDLPEKVFQTLNVEMDTPEAKAYKQMKETLILEYGDEVLTVQNQVTLLTRLRQIAGGFYPETGEPISKKPSGIEMLMEDVSEYSGQVIIACDYVAEVKGIIAALEKEYGKEQVVSFYGDTKDRDELKRRFKEDKIKFLVGTVPVMAYGHNWQFVSLMYRYSMSYSYEKNKQLIKRIHRPGMVGEAIYKTIVHTGTVQQKTVDAFENKSDMVSKFDTVTLKDFLD